MDRLLSGIKKFRLEVLEEQEDFYESLRREQHPHTLFITCSDSRILPSRITGTNPGELFVVRNGPHNPLRLLEINFLLRQTNRRRKDLMFL